MFDIGLNRAVTLIAEKVAKGPSRRFGADPGKAIGDHPTLGTVTVKSGRYGAYVTAGGVNATIPAEFEKDTVTLPQAIALIDERAAKGGGKTKAKKAAKPAKAKKAAEKAADGDDAAPKPKKPAAKKAAKPKSESTSKARAAVSSTAKTSPTKAAAPKAPAKKSAGKT